MCLSPIVVCAPPERWKTRTQSDLLAVLLYRWGGRPFFSTGKSTGRDIDAAEAKGRFSTV